MNYRPEIDGLRAVAVLPVVLFHAGYSAFGGGFVGVDVFFVISGYLITGLIAAELRTNTFSLRSFYERRARRILPALFAVAMVCIPVAWHILMPRELAEFLQSIVAVSTFSSNVFFWLTSGYFDVAAELKPLLHTWSLAVEEQFYIVFPMLLMFLWRRVRENPIAILSFLAAASYLAAVMTAISEPDRAFFLFHTRSWELLAGGILALVSRGEIFAGVHTRARQFLSGFGLALILGAVAFFDEASRFPGPVALAPVAGTILVIAFADSGTLAFRMLSSRLLVGVGLISYSLYLWHQPIFAFAKYATHGQLSGAEIFLLTLLPFPLAYATWRFVEQPARNRKIVRTNRLVTMSASCGACLIAFGLFSYSDVGRDTRVVENPLLIGGEVGHDVFHQRITESYSECRVEAVRKNTLDWNGIPRCVQSKQGREVDVAIVGDSHAEHLFAGIADNLHDENVIYLTRIGAPLISSPQYEDVFDYIVEARGLSEVILAAYWSRILAGPEKEKLRDELAETVGFLRSRGVRVVLAGDVANFRFDAQECKYSLGPARGARCSEAENLAVVRTEREVFTEIAASDPGVSFVPIRDVLCNDGNCNMHKDKVLLYRDNNHLNLAGSIMLGEVFVERLGAARNGAH